MARYNMDEAYRVYADKVQASRDGLEKVDLTLLDMIGYFLWNYLKEDVKDQAKQDAVFGSLLAAFVAGRELERGESLIKELFEFIEQLEIDPGPVDSIKDLMNW